MNEMKSLTLNGTKYDSFPDQTAREGLEQKQPKGNYIKSVNGTVPDENGNVQIDLPNSVEGAVLYIEQELTPEQQEQARNNIGAMPKDAEISLSTKQINALDALFKAASYIKDASAEYAAFCVAFGLSEPNPMSLLMYREVTLLENKVAAVVSKDNPTKMMVYATKKNARRLAWNDGQTWTHDSEYSPLPIPEGAVNAVFTLPEGMWYAIAMLGETAGSDVSVDWLKASGIVRNNTGTYNVSSYNDGKHYWAANLMYADGRVVPSDFDINTVDIHFVDATGNKIS